MAESKEELNSLWMKVKEESEKDSLKLNVQKMKIMASSPITSWQIDGETIETQTDFIFLCSKITADGDCSHEIKRRLLLGRKAMANLDSILNSRDTTLLTKVHLFKAMVFSSSYIWMWELDHKEKAEHWKTDAFKCVLEKTLECLLDCKEIQSILKEINRECLLEGLMLKLKLQYFGHLMQRTDSLEKMLMLGKTEGRKRAGWQWMRWLDGVMDSVDINLSQFRRWWMTEMPGKLQAMGLQRARHNWVTEQQERERDLNSLEINPNCIYIKLFKYIFYLKS